MSLSLLRRHQPHSLLLQIILPVLRGHPVCHQNVASLQPHGFYKGYLVKLAAVHRQDRRVRAGIHGIFNIAVQLVGIRDAVFDIDPFAGKRE